MTSQWLDHFVQNPWMVLSGYLLALVGLVLTIRSRRLRRPVYAIRDQRLVTETVSALPRLAILYDGQSVANLTVTRLALWNAGSETISKEDVPPLDPIRISSAAKVLDASVLAVTDRANDCRLAVQTDQSYLVQFEYLDPQDGVLLQIIHTGAAERTVTVLGKSKGVREVRLVTSLGDDYPKGLKGIRARLPLLAGSLLPLGAVVLFGYFAILAPIPPDFPAWRLILLGAMKLVAGLAACFFLFVLWQGWTAAALPSSFTALWREPIPQRESQPKR